MFFRFLVFYRTVRTVIIIIMYYHYYYYFYYHHYEHLFTQIVCNGTPTAIVDSATE